MSPMIRGGARTLAGALITAAFALSTSGCSKSAPAPGGEAEQAAQTPEAAKSAAAEATPVEPAEEAEDQAAGAAGGAASLLAEGAEAPDFTAEAHDGTTIQMSALRGEPVVLYFYPKDETPGCTAEAQAFRDELPGFEKLGVRVIGVSLDSLDAHKAFADNHDLNFPLVPDPEGEIAASYGVDTSGGYARRVTFVIGADGKIAKVYAEVQVQGHADEVLAFLQSMK